MTVKQSEMTREQLNDYHKEWRAKNAEANRAIQNAWYHRNKDFIKLKKQIRKEL